MKRIALFVEGQTEMVFLQSLLHWIFGYNIHYICKELSSYDIIPWKQYEYGKDNSSPDFDFMIINVGGEGTLRAKPHQQRRALFGITSSPCSEGYRWPP